MHTRLLTFPLNMNFNYTQSTKVARKCVNDYIKPGFVHRHPPRSCGVHTLYLIQCVAVVQSVGAY